uniref:Putative capsid protein n=1 Tax=Tarsiger cyanurus Genomoviridae sp. TaxID=2814994 RepID=A0A8A4XDH7_9VIRU|nr:MAG: capsid protein [Gemygorvirus]
MPYARKRYVSRRRRPSTRRYRKTSAKTRRTYRKPIRRMSKRAILNTTSRKKRDTMMPYTNITAATQSGGTTYANGSAIITGGTSTTSPIVWCATARDNEISAGGTAGNVFNEATRTATTCFMKGIRETVQIQVSDDVPWLWRRICFTYKGVNASLPSTNGFNLQAELSSGWQRVVNMVPNAAYVTTLNGLLFKGSQYVDWLDAMTAPIDNRRVTIKYDKTRTIASNNEGGCIKKFNLYHPMNSNLVYDDDENGGGENVSFFSVQGKAGMGDYMIVDYFQPRTGSATTNRLSFNPSATLYWHEK